MASLPISNPGVPFVGLIPGGLSFGRMLRIKGQMTHGADRFAIYVQRGPSTWPRDNCPIHLSVRPNENAIVRNHYTNQQWANEERHGGCPIQRGTYFEITIAAEPSYFNITINGSHFCTFNYRLPVMGNSQYISIEGDCTLSFVGQDTDLPYMTPTPYAPIVSPPMIGIHPNPPYVPPSHFPPSYFPPGPPHHKPIHPPHHHHHQPTPFRPPHHRH